MKKIGLIAFFALLCLALLLCACDKVDNASSVDNSSQLPTEDISSPSEAQSGDVLSQPVSAPDQSVTSDDGKAPDASAPDNTSAPDDTSVPDNTGAPDDTSTPENKPDGYDGLMPIPVGSVRAAKGYRIAYTKESPLSATECITNCAVEITAIYDGAVTRFFDAVNGTYYHAVAGKYLYPCCHGFLAGTRESPNENYSICFSRDKDDRSIVTYTINTHDGHGNDDLYAIYCESDQKVYFYDYALYRVEGDGAVACRYYSASSPLDAYIKDGYIIEIIEYSAIGKYGIVKNGKIIVPFEYDLILSGQDEEGVGVYMAKKNGKTYYIASDGTVLTPDGFDCGSQPYKNRAWVFDGGQGYMLEFN